MATKASILEDALKAYAIRIKRSKAIDTEYDAAQKAFERAKSRIEAASERKTKNDTERQEFADIVTSLGGELPEVPSADDVAAVENITVEGDSGDVNVAEGDVADETPRKGGRFTRKS